MHSFVDLTGAKHVQECDDDGKCCSGGIGQQHWRDEIISGVPPLANGCPGTYYAKGLPPHKMAQYGFSEELQNGMPYPKPHNNIYDMIHNEVSGIHDKYCADWTIPSGCQMMTYDEIATGTINAMERFKEKALERISGGCSHDFEMRQFWSSTGLPINGMKTDSVNEFNVPFHQKWNAYYITIRANPETSKSSRFRIAAQIYVCSDGRVGSQVFSQSNQDTFNDKKFCDEKVDWNMADTIWREVIGEVHKQRKLNGDLPSSSGGDC